MLNQIKIRSIHELKSKNEINENFFNFETQLARICSMCDHGREEKVESYIDLFAMFKDDNDQDVYFNDIVKETVVHSEHPYDTNPIEVNNYYIVGWDENDLKVIFYNKNEKFDFKDLKNIEKVGNIYKNKDLFNKIMD